ncbi:hypothetical protein GCM10017600_75070 [Streptosporangium carneum]|uniref:Uncharacterized protein n=1 Tax=Streptosporangium carneum TaxID=47481 RepID=A0A9W6MHE3_9ACTN|nr:hypothetical protein GCM10017600_75070 [Streptosporangium carneum]
MSQACDRLFIDTSRPCPSSHGRVAGWALTVDTAERDTLAALAQDCPNVPLPTVAAEGA